MIKCYSDLIKLPTFEERFRYLMLYGRVGEDTFGYDRYLNQLVYKNYKWRKLRDQIIIRDNACDLGVDGYYIQNGLYVHHMNPISKKDIEDNTEFMWNPEYLICVSFATHNAIHYGDLSFLERNKLVERRPGDTIPWEKHF